MPVIRCERVILFVEGVFFQKIIVTSFIEYGHEIEMYTVEQGEKRDKRQ